MSADDCTESFTDYKWSIFADIYASCGVIKFWPIQVGNFCIVSHPDVCGFHVAGTTSFMGGAKFPKGGRKGLAAYSRADRAMERRGFCP